MSRKFFLLGIQKMRYLFIIATFLILDGKSMAQEIQEYLKYVLQEDGSPKKEIIETLLIHFGNDTEESSPSPIKQTLTLEDKYLTTLSCFNADRSFYFAYDILVYRRELRDEKNQKLEPSSIQDEFFIRPVPLLSKTPQEFSATFHGKTYIPTIYLGVALKYSETNDALEFRFSGAVEDKLINPMTFSEEYSMLFFNENQRTDGIVIDIKTNKVVAQIDCQLAPAFY